MAQVINNGGYECVGVIPYSFTPNGETSERNGYTVWFLEQGRIGSSGCIPFKSSFNVQQFNNILSGLGAKNASDLIGNFYAITFNRWGKVESMTLIDVR